MKLNDLRRRIAAAIAPDRVENHDSRFMPPAELEPLENPPLPPDPGHAQPLTTDQRANLEKLRDRLAPDRQRPPTTRGPKPWTDPSTYKST